MSLIKNKIFKGDDVMKLKMQAINDNVQVKIIEARDSRYLEDRITEFLKDKMLVDIKYNTHAMSDGIKHVVMILYVEYPF